MLQTLGRLSLLVSTALLAATAHAGIVYQPSSIVQSQDGTYVTDTVNNLDWYKFSNAQSTVGLSMLEVNSFIAGTNWSVASIAQVRGLQSQFGWTSDTLSLDFNDNFGLTDAMGDFLGFTAIGSAINIEFPERVSLIEAMVAEGEQQYVNGQLLQYHQVTASVTTAYLDAQNDPYLFFGDRVNGNDRLFLNSYHDSTVGTWLSRAHSATGGGGDADCGRLAPCPPSDVPEPASYALVGVALLSLGFTRRRRSV